MAKYLDETGVARLWAKIKERDNDIINNATVNAAYKDGAGNTISTTYINVNQKGVNNGVATLGSDGKIPSTQLPSYVDDVLEYASTSSFPSTGESGKIYVALDTNKTYRWSGSQYTEISASLVIGTTAGTAFDGARGLAVEQSNANKLNMIAESDNLSSVYTNVYNYAQMKTQDDGSDISSIVKTYYNDVDDYGVMVVSYDIDNVMTGITVLGFDHEIDLTASGGVMINGYRALDTSMALTTAEIDAILV